MNIVSVAAVGVVGALVAIAIKQYKPELAILISIITSVIIFSQVISSFLPVIADIKSMLNRAEISFEHLTILFKSIGICYLTQFIIDVCKDAGQAAIASKIELAGKVAICLISLPLFYDLISLLEKIIGKVT